MFKINSFNTISSFYKTEQGASSIIYAIMFPIILGVISIAIDGSNALVVRARLADAVNEAGLVIAAINNINKTEEGRAHNISITKNYIEQYIRQSPKNISSVNVSVNDKSTEIFDPHIDYYIDATVRVNTFLPLATITGIGDSINVNNYNNNSGNVRKSLNSPPADVIFVVDFSGSTTCEYGETCNSWGDRKGREQRLDMLKDVVQQVVNDHMDTDTQFAIVPFDIGVPFRPEDAVNLPGSGINEAGGKNVGCSIVYAPNDAFKNIDYNFWANKKVPFSDYPTYSDNARYIDHDIDLSRFEYYRLIVSPALKTNFSSLIDNKWCINNYLPFDSPSHGKYIYSCEANNNDSIFENSNRHKITNQYNSVANLLKTMYEVRGKGQFSIANIETVNVQKTIDNMFNPDYIQEFWQPWAPNSFRQRAFTMMCQSAQYNTLITANDADKPISELYARAAEVFSSAEPQTFLIPLTSNKTEKQQLLDNFITMTPGGGTDSLSGLLRAVPIAAKGLNPIKIIIVISDGQDDGGAVVLGNIFHKPPYKVCDAIKSGLKSTENLAAGLIKTKAQSAAIHYISISGDSSEKIRMDFWKDNCGNGDTQTVHSATDYTELLDAINTQIIATETGNFIRDNSAL